MAPCRTDFPEHPYTPYPIQQQFMEELYKTLEDSAIGLFESPTGTGKTISIICGALHWLEDHRQRAKEADAAQAADGFDDDDPGWLRAHRTTTASTSVPEAHPWLKRRGGLAAAGPLQLVQPHTLGRTAAPRRCNASAGEAAVRPAVSLAAAAASSAGAGGCGTVGVDEAAAEQFLLERTAADDQGGEEGGGVAGGAGGRAVGLRRARMRALHLGPDGSSGEEEGDDSGDGGEEDDRRKALRVLRAPPAPPARTPQIFFASRTHSQLAQFVSELRRTGFASRLRLLSLASRRGLCVHEPVAALGPAALITERCTELQERSKNGGGSKAQRTHGSCGSACGRGSGSAAAAASGPGGRRRGQGSRIAGGGACPFLTPSLESTADFAAAVLGEPMDVEDLGRTGRRLGLCPYYGSRALLPEADVVALPYNALLSEETRGSLGLRLDGSIVIFDEAHNLVDAVMSTHGSQVSLEQLITAITQLTAYFNRFQSRLSPASARNVQLLLRLATALQRCLLLPHSISSNRVKAAADSVAVLGCHDFLVSVRMEHLNLFPLLSWVRDSRLVMKVAGYDLACSTKPSTGPGGTAGAAAAAVEAVVDLHDDEDDGNKGARSAPGATRGNAAAAVGRSGSGSFGARRSALFAFVSFLTALTHSNTDGRIVVSAAATGGSGDGGAADTDACLRYTVLNAASQFASIIAAARSVVLASGTLSPVDGLVAQLLPGVPHYRLRHFSCGHVVPRENLLALVAARGPTGIELDLRHGRRTDPRVSEELGRLLVNVCTAVPAGLVVFAPSFAYLDQLVEAWRRSGVWSALTSRKQVFVEPRSAGEVEAVLRSYAAVIQRAKQPPAPVTESSAVSAVTEPGSGSARRLPSGAVLLSVVGGKLSEGINFGDDLGRCVVVLGLPYPNPSDPELRERMRYLDETAAAAATTTTASISPAAAAAATVAARPSPSLPSSSPSSPLPARPRLTGRQYYDGLCIKAVNQCVGRVIRHERDYAAIVLVDQRYMPPPSLPGARGAGAGGAAAAAVVASVAGSLPGWIQQSLRPGTGDFGHLYGNLVGFFRGKAAAATAAATSGVAGSGCAVAVVANG